MTPARILPVLAVLCALGMAGGDEVTLRDGQILDGEVVSPAGAAVVDVRIRAGGMEATRHIPREQIAAIRIGASAAQKQAEALQARRDRLGTGGTAEDWWQLAQEAKRARDQLQFRACVNEVLVRDRHHEAARHIIGHLQHRGIWMRPEEMAVACGQVRFRDQWVSWQDQERILADEAQARTMAMAQLEERRRVSSVIDTAAYAVPPAIPPVYRAMYWPGAFMGGGGYVGSGCGHPGGSIGASGGGGGLRWRFNWNL